MTSNFMRIGTHSRRANNKKENICKIQSQESKKARSKLRLGKKYIW